VNNSTSSLETLERYPACADAGALERLTAGKIHIIASCFYSVFNSSQKRTFSTSNNEWLNRLSRFFATFSPAIANFAFGE
jgi:hypothetical protein